MKNKEIEIGDLVKDSRTRSSPLVGFIVDIVSSDPYDHYVVQWFNHNKTRERRSIRVPFLVKVSDAE